jgi:hypothetical protein
MRYFFFIFFHAFVSFYFNFAFRTSFFTFPSDVQAFAWMPIACIVTNHDHAHQVTAKIFCCHGGIPRAINDKGIDILAEIRQIPRPLFGMMLFYFLFNISDVSRLLLFSQ